MEACEILAEVIIEGIVYLGEAPQTGVYMCSAMAIFPYTRPVSPYACRGIVSVTAIGKWLGQNEQFKKLAIMAAEEACTITVDFDQSKTKITISKMQEIHEKTRKGITETKRKYSKINSYEGISWLMKYLSSY